MVFVIIGIAVGIIFGSAFLGEEGWLLGGFVGTLAGLVIQQIKKINTLEGVLKTLVSAQEKTNAQLNRLESDLSHKPKTAPIITSSVIKNNNDSPASAAANQTLSAVVIESVELDLPVEFESDVELELSAELALPSALEPPTSIPSKVILSNIKDSKANTIKVAAPTTLPSDPNVVDKVFATIRRFFTEGNLIVRIGMIIMFIGISFLVKYASGQGLFPIEFRLIGVILGAIALLIVGWKTRARPGSYGLVLQGGGIAVIYLTLFAAAKIYGLIPLGLAFSLLFVVVVFGVLLALLQNTQVLAILATAGGFVAPILTSTGEGSHVALFSFYLILNLGILTIALYKAWRLLNWVGFMFTFVITAAWGVLKYEPTLYASTQPFLIAFFVLYLIVSILFSFKQPTNLKGMVDGSLVFGLPLVAFGLQISLLKHTEYGLAISAIILAVIYILLSFGLSRRYLQTHRVLVESFLALGASFATLTIPLALNASWTSVTWALEATGLVWVGLRQQRLRPRVVGYLLHAAAAISLVFVEGVHAGVKPLISGDFLGLTLLALTGFTIAYLLHYFYDQLRHLEKTITPIAIAFGLLWWFVAGINEISAHVVDEHQFAAIILFAALSAIIIMLVSQNLSWILLDNSVFVLLPFMLLFFAIVFVVDDHDVHPSQGFSLIAIALFLLTQYRFLFKKEKTVEFSNSKLLSTWHILTAWGVFALIFWEVSWQKSYLNLHGTAEVMIWFSAIVIPVVLLMGAGQKKFWPFITFSLDYKNWIPAPLFILSAFWFFAVCHKTVIHNDHYVPILNPLDLAQFAIVLIFAYAVKHQFMDAISFISNKIRMSLLGIMLFVWINVVTVRAMSHYQNIPYDFYSLWSATQVQMALSILWTLCALVLMNLSRKLQHRQLWIIGAALLAVVVLKLGTKDLAGSGTLAGIISFMVVGALMLLIGFLSPIPAQQKNEKNINEDNIVGNNKGESHE